MPRGDTARAIVASLPLVVLLVAFASTFGGFLESWASPAYNHGYLVAVAGVWLAWRERAALQSMGPLAAETLPMLGGLSLVWLIATVTSVRVVAQGVLPLILLAWCAAAWGSAVARRFVPIAVLWLLAVPMWEILVPPLQVLTTTVSGLILSVVRVPAVITGNVVEIESGTFLIEDGCSGLNYLLAGLTIGALYGHLFMRTWRGRINVLAAAAGVAIVGNWLRVATLIIIGHLTGMQSGLMEEHLTYGWAIFLMGLVAFFPWARHLERRELARLRTRTPVTGPAPDTGTDAAAPSPPEVAGPPVLWPRATLVATLTAVIGPILYYAVALTPGHEPAPLDLQVAPDWQSSSPTPDDRPWTWLPAFTGATEHMSQSWTDGEHVVVSDRLVYRDQTQGAELIGYGNRIAPDSTLISERLMGPVGTRRRLVNEAIVREGDGYLLVWSWYRVAGAETESSARAKLLELWAFVTLSRVSELVALSTPCEGDSCAEAFGVLSRFLGST